MRMPTAHAEATKELSIVKYQLEVSEARILAEGVEGQDAEQRDIPTS
jgi:hypothetical protein